MAWKVFCLKRFKAYICILILIKQASASRYKSVTAICIIKNFDGRDKREKFEIILNVNKTLNELPLSFVFL